jgi:hypothetical protein
MFVSGGGGSLFRIRNITCNWQQPKWRFIKYDTHATYPIYIFFSIDSSEAREKYVEYYLSNMQTINYVLDRTHFQGLGWVVPFNVREYVHFCNCLLYFLPFKTITIGIFVFAIVLLFSSWAEVAIAHANSKDGCPESNYSGGIYQVRCTCYLSGIFSFFLESTIQRRCD